MVHFAILEGIGPLLTTGGPFAALTIAVTLGYRLTRQARLDAIDTYKNVSDEAREILAAERLQWAAERAELQRQVREANGQQPPTTPGGAQ